MLNNNVDGDNDVSSTVNSCNERKYKIFNFEESPQNHSEDGCILNRFRLSTYAEKNINSMGFIKLSMLPENTLNEIQSSMNDWEDYMRCKEHEVLTKSILITSIVVPDVRFCEVVIQYSHRRDDVNNISFTCSKMEITSHDDSWTDEISEERKTEKKLLADAEKARGNKAYKAGDLVKACEHYSNSIALVPSKEVFNNRAQANIKMQNYMSALLDVNQVLKEDPLNTKALCRRAVCRFSIRMFHEALCDIQTVLNFNPRNKETLSLLANVRREISKLTGRKFRIRLVGNLEDTFEVDASQLPVYAKLENDYVLETDKSGCAKTCVCSFCTLDDQITRRPLSALRIGERPRWHRLTSELLNEMRVEVNATSTASTPDVTPTTADGHLEQTKNECSMLVDSSGDNRQKTSVEKLNEKEVLRAKKTSATTTSYIASDVVVASPAASQTKSSKGAINANRRPAKCFKNVERKLVSKEPCWQNDSACGILKNIPPTALKAKFDNRLDESTLWNLIHYVCEMFEPERDWPLMGQYLNAIASLERFRAKILFIDSETKLELLSVFRKAINLNLENATQLKALYF